MTNDNKRVLALTEFGGYSYKAEPDRKGKVFGYSLYKDKEKLEKAITNLYLNQVIPMIDNQGMSVSVYTQLTDVEEEINGIFTVDRKLKIRKETWQYINKSIYEAFERAVNNE